MQGVSCFIVGTSNQKITRYRKNRLSFPECFYLKIEDEKERLVLHYYEVPKTLTAKYVITQESEFRIQKLRKEVYFY